MHRLQNLSEYLRASLWFLPTLIVVGAVLLALGLIEVAASGTDRDLADRFPRLFGAGADGSRGLLSAIAGSMITVAGTTFSITIVALAQASSQYTSRILRNFMRDRASQSVLGVFVGVFAYCLVVLRTIRSGEDGLFVPALAVLGGALLAFVAIGFLIFFIHHIAISIQASSIIAQAAAETLRAVDRLFPSEAGEGVDVHTDHGTEANGTEANDKGLGGSIETWATIAACKSGYVQTVDTDRLLALAREWDLVIRMERGVGEFVTDGAPLASLSAVRTDEKAVARLNAAYTLDRFRTVQQDAAYGIRQIVDIALKSLSPGINDTTTAINCLDYLNEIMSRLAERTFPSPFRSDDGRLRLIARGPTFPGLLAEAFDQIRQNAAGNVAVLAHLIRSLDLIAGRTSDPRRRRAISRQRDRVVELARRSVSSPHDLAALQAGEDRFSTHETHDEGQRG